MEGNWANYASLYLRYTIQVDNFEDNFEETSRNGLKVAKAGHKSEGHMGIMADRHDGMMADRHDGR